MADHTRWMCLYFAPVRYSQWGCCESPAGFTHGLIASYVYQSLNVALVRESDDPCHLRPRSLFMICSSPSAPAPTLSSAFIQPKDFHLGSCFAMRPANVCANRVVQFLLPCTSTRRFYDCIRQSRNSCVTCGICFAPCLGILRLLIFLERRLLAAMMQSIVGNGAQTRSNYSHYPRERRSCVYHTHHFNFVKRSNGSPWSIDCGQRKVWCQSQQ